MPDVEAANKAGYLIKLTYRKVGLIQPTNWAKCKELWPRCVVVYIYCISGHFYRMFVIVDSNLLVASVSRNFKKCNVCIY